MEDIELYSDLANPAVFYVIQENKDSREEVVYSFNTDTKKKVELFKIDFDITEAKVSNSQLILLGMPFTGKNVGSEVGTIAIWDLKNKSKVNQFDFHLPTDEYSGSLVYSGIKSWDLSQDAKNIIVSTFWGNRWGHGGVTSQVARIFDLSSGEKIQEVTSSREIKNVKFLEDHIVQINTTGYDLEKEEYIYEYIVPKEESGSEKYAYSSKELNVIYTSGNELELYQAESNQLLLTISVLKNGEWFACTPDGYYAVSKNAGQFVNWGVDGMILPLETFKKKCNKPSIIESRLKAVHRGENVSLDDSPVFSQEDFGKFN